jgi:hypothetical protein
MRVGKIDHQVMAAELKILFSNFLVLEPLLELLAETRSALLIKEFRAAHSRVAQLVTPESLFAVGHLLSYLQLLSGIEIELRRLRDELDNDAPGFSSFDALLLDAPDKIAAIKLYRDKFGASLKESKEYIERLWSAHGVLKPTTSRRSPVANPS